MVSLSCGLLAAARVALVLFMVLARPAAARAGEIRTNAVVIPEAPSWLTARDVDKVVDRIQRVLEWDIRRVNVVWYTDEAAFEQAHHLGPTVLAFSRKSDNSVQVGPRVDKASFPAIFGHELVHVIIYQKFKEAIPAWIEEGLANYLAGQGHVDYAWLKRHGVEGDVRKLVHPFQGIQPGALARDEHARYHYLASQALTEMVAAHCDLEQLLQLSVGKKLETYLSTFCGITDLNGEFRSWIAAH